MSEERKKSKSDDLLDIDVKQAIRVTTNRLDTVRAFHSFVAFLLSFIKEGEKKIIQLPTPLVVFVLCIKPPYIPGVEPRSPNLTLDRLTMGPRCLA